MTNKYKISELAKDFGLTSKDIIKIIAEKTGADKKSSTALDEKEISLVFDTLTKQNEVKSFADYFATGAESRAAAKKAREEEKNKKLAEQMAILEQLKAAAAAQNGEKPAEPVKAEKKAEPKKAEVKAEVKAETAKPAEKKAEEKLAADKKPEQAAKPAEKKPEEKKQPEPKKEERKAEEKKPEEKKHGVSDPKPFVSQKKDKKPGEAPKRGPAEIRHIDTRTSNVNIDKYNEKYERIAPANTMRDNFSRKQKIKQKSQDYRRPQGAKRETEADKMRRLQLERIKKTPITVTVGDEITVGELAAALKKTAAEVIKVLLKLGMMATVNQVIDYDTAEIVVTEMGAKIEKQVVVTIEEASAAAAVLLYEALRQRS